MNLTQQQAVNAWADARRRLNRLEHLETREAYLAFHDRHAALAASTPAAVGHHHAWPGGYAVHIAEVLKLTGLFIGALPFVKVVSGWFGLVADFTKDEAITSAYIHDLDKLLVRYVPDQEPPTSAQVAYAKSLGIRVDNDTKTTMSIRIDAAKNGTTIYDDRLSRHARNPELLDCDDSGLVALLCMQHGLAVNLQVLHVVAAAHGGWSSLARTTQHFKMSMLATLVHCADLISANICKGVAWMFTPTPSESPVDDIPPPPPE